MAFYPKRVSREPSEWTMAEGPLASVRSCVMHTPWPTVWSRRLRSSQQISRENARRATRVLAERRAEREAIERYLSERSEVI